jgi:hypothetical protein
MTPAHGLRAECQTLSEGMANEFIDQMKSTLEEAKSALQKSKDDMTCYYNHH